MIGNRIERRTLKEMIRQGEKMAVFLANGYKESGVIIAFDRNTILLRKDDGGKKLIYKSVISTIKKYKFIEERDSDKKKED